MPESGEKLQRSFPINAESPPAEKALPPTAPWFARLT